MNTKLVDIQPRELKFIFELKKQSSCCVQLFNNSNHHVAFKVKTTSPKKYCVRPNTGTIDPKSTCEFTVTMQAQRLVPPDMVCKDKFLVQTTVVPAGTTNEDITSSTFAKDDGKYIDESKLRVILVSPPDSPVVSPISGTLKQVPAYEPSILKDQLLSKVEGLTQRHTVPAHESSILNDQVPSKDESLTQWHTVTKEVEESKLENGELKPENDVEYVTMKGTEELKLVKDIEDMKSEINELESKLSEAKVTISKLTEERRLTFQERESLQKELALLRSKRNMRKVQVGFPLLFVCMVALISVMLGYLLHR
ncbi:vesicle-associated protein 2-2-like isoform X2 [Cornus florida]|uniref:vesicle-associated protein 2-2-like isoform X2 n=1 Tax=Cornus florida TaxID=4283 RepID=UPI002896A723|nr:vesicle-associated protein 2-2-like isoform X2 [Cornus florida]